MSSSIPLLDASEETEYLLRLLRRGIMRNEGKEELRYALTHGANPLSVLNEQDDTALHFGCYNKRFEGLFALLCYLQTVPDLHVQAWRAQNYKGDTPAHHLVSRCTAHHPRWYYPVLDTEHLSSESLLVKVWDYADPLCVNNNGVSPLDIMAQQFPTRMSEEVPRYSAYLNAMLDACPPSFLWPNTGPSLAAQAHRENPLLRSCVDERALRHVLNAPPEKATPVRKRL